MDVNVDVDMDVDKHTDVTKMSLSEALCATRAAADAVELEPPPTSGHMVGSISGMAPRVSAIRTASTQKNNGWRELGAKRADELIVALGVASSSVVPIYLSFLLKCASATIGSFG